MVAYLCMINTFVLIVAVLWRGEKYMLRSRKKGRWERS